MTTANQTIRQVITAQLIGMGMFDNQANEVVALAEEKVESMQGRWDSQASDYPPAVVKITFMHVKKVALEWINNNAPQAWFKPLFE